MMYRMEYYKQNPGEVHLLSIFPEEIWKIIVEGVHDAADFFHLCESSPYFKQLCKHLRVRTLFPEVAKVLYLQLQKYRRAPQQVMTKCRMVCRAWQKGVDDVLHSVEHSEHCYKLQDAESLGILSPIPFKYHTDCFRTLEDVELFRRRFDETHGTTNRNPFVCRRVLIECGDREDTDIRHIFQKILQLLRVYGHHIWYCLLSVGAHRILGNALSYFNNAREVLELMPNLRTLTLIGSEFRNLSELKLEDVKLKVESHPFPELKQLQYIHCFSVPTPIFDGLLLQNPHVRMLAVLSRNSTGTNVLFREMLSGLEQLSIRLQRDRQFLQLERLAFKWPLKKLSASVTDSIRVGDLFRLLKNKWAESLTELTLFLGGDEHLIVPVLELSKLEAFTLQTKFFTPLDFLLACKHSLSSLTVYVTVNYSNADFQPRLQSALENENAVRFYGFRNNLINSNIWILFPKLRSVEYTDWELTLERRHRPATRKFDWMLRQLENT